MDFKLNDVVWYSPPRSNLVIRCKIVDINTTFRDRHPDGKLFYWIDEPVGHSLESDELFYETPNFECGDVLYRDLLDYRVSTLSFIVHTHKLDPAKERKIFIELFSSLDDKVYKKDWFFLEDLENT